jgi:hypothetical protein
LLVGLLGGPGGGVISWVIGELLPKALGGGSLLFCGCVMS